MASARSRYGLLFSALGAVLLAVSVFLPWYGVSFTSSGVALAQQAGDQAIAQFGSAALQGQTGVLHAGLAGLAGREIFAVSAHQVLKDMNIVLLVLAGLALLDALVPLALAAAPVSDGAGASVAVLGGVASLCVIYRMLVPPTPAGNVVAMSIREGAWLALAGSVTMLIAGVWRRLPDRAAREPQLQAPWSRLSGWTPEA